jgi:hypothetical protein
MNQGLLSRTVSPRKRGFHEYSRWRQQNSNSRSPCAGGVHDAQDAIQATLRLRTEAEHRN